MQRKDAQKLSELLPQILADQQLDRRLDETQAAVLWKEIFGEAVARYTTQVYVWAGVLYVSLSSAVLRNELLSCKKSLLHRLNEEMGRLVVKDIILR